MYIYVWLAVFVLSLIVEAATAGLASIWFAGGALVAMLLTFLGVAPVWQVVAFVVISLLLLALTRPLARKYINKRAADLQNSESAARLSETYRTYQPSTVMTSVRLSPALYLLSMYLKRLYSHHFRCSALLPWSMAR